MAYERVLLKLSGEVLAGDEGFGIDSAKLEQVAAEVAAVHALGIELASDTEIVDAA